MKSCRNCIHFSACESWAKIFKSYDDCAFPYEYDENEDLCKQYNQQTLPPAYIGLKVWLPDVYISHKYNIHLVELNEGKVSGLQQKADGSWKIRITNKCSQSVSDYTVEEFNKRVFLIKEDAEKYMEDRLKEYEND